MVIIIHFNLGEPRKTLVCGNVKCFSLEPQDKKTKICSATFSQLQLFFYVYDFTDIDECKGNNSCHVNATCKNILGSHVCQCHAGYTGNGQNCAGEINLVVTIFRIVLHDTFNYSAAPFSRVARQLDNLSLRNSAILSSYIENNTWDRVDLEFLFECSTRYLITASNHVLFCLSYKYNRPLLRREVDFFEEFNYKFHNPRKKSAKEGYQGESLTIRRDSAAVEVLVQSNN